MVQSSKGTDSYISAKSPLSIPHHQIIPRGNHFFITKIFVYTSRGFSVYIQENTDIQFFLLSTNGNLLHKCIFILLLLFNHIS